MSLSVTKSGDVKILAPVQGTIVTRVDLAPNGDGRGEAVAIAVYGPQRIGVVAQCVPQPPHRLGQRILGDHPAGPAGLQQFLLGDDLAGMAQQRQQHVVAAAVQGNANAVHRQFGGAFIQLGADKAHALRAKNEGWLGSRWVNSGCPE